jgi:hypothetical protein
MIRKSRALLLAALFHPELCETWGKGCDQNEASGIARENVVFKAVFMQFLEYKLPFWAGLSRLGGPR